jgi:diaminopimelate epimerase
VTPPRQSSISFTKATACGNDFLIVPATGIASDLAILSRRLCDRHNGVGADGVEWTCPDSEADVHAKLINADGSEAEISGNGTRCVAADISSRSEKTQIVVRTGAGLKTCRLVSSRNPVFEFETDMGSAVVHEPVAIETMWVRAVGTRVSIGNPHFVLFVERFEDGWQRQAALIQTQPLFPQGTNVEYVKVRGPNEIEIRLFERGVGETQSSGTGSCAAAVAAIAGRRVASPVTVVAAGGAQTVCWDDTVNPNCVRLRGPATLICRGEFFI